MTKRTTFLLLFVIIIIAGFLRLYKITELPPGLYPDEAMNGNNALEALRTAPPAGGFKVYYPENNGREGLFINIQAILLGVAGIREPWLLRLPSAIFGILTVLGIFFLTKELFRTNPKTEALNTKQITNANNSNSKQLGNSNLGNWGLFRNSKLEIRNYEVALLSSFLLATSFWHINFSRIGFRAIMTPFFLIWGLYLFLLAIRQAREGKHAKSGIVSAAAGAIYGLGFYTYIAYRITPLLLLLFIPFFRKQKGFWRVVATFLIATFVAALPIGIYYLKNPADFLGRTAQVSVFSSGTPLRDLTLNTIKTLGMFNFVGDGNWRHNYSGRPELYWPVGIMFIIGAILALKTLAQNIKISARGGSALGGKNRNESLKFKDNSFPFLILWGWFIVAALPVVISNEGIPHALRSILILPPVIIFAAVGGMQLYQVLKKRLSPAYLETAATVFLVLLAFEAYTTYFILWGKNPNTQGAFASDYLQIGRTINSLPKETPKYVVVEAGGVDVRGIPMPAQTVMFITDTFSPEARREKNIHYVLPDKETGILSGALKFYLR